MDFGKYVHLLTTTTIMTENISQKVSSFPLLVNPPLLGTSDLLSVTIVFMLSRLLLNEIMQ